MGRDCSIVNVDLCHNCKPMSSNKQMALPHMMSVVAQAEPRQVIWALLPLKGHASSLDIRGHPSRIVNRYKIDHSYKHNSLRGK